MGRPAQLLKTYHSKKMGNILPYSLLLVYYICYPHACSEEVSQKTLHLCSLCDGFPQVAGNSGCAFIAVLVTKSDIRMMISCWTACTCDTSGRTRQSWDLVTLN
jgi:hypothetical protein